MKVLIIPSLNYQIFYFRESMLYLRMPYPRRIIFFVLFLGIAPHTLAGVMTDTSVKKMIIPITKGNLQGPELMLQIGRGVLAIRADSVEKGIQLIVTGMNQVNHIVHTDRIMGYA